MNKTGAERKKQKMKNVMIALTTVLVFAMAMSVMAETANTVKVTKFHQSYPYSGKATIEYTVGGVLPDNAVAEITLNTDDASATFIQKNIVTGANSHVIDFSSSFGDAMLLTNASFVVTIVEGLVQLWENGPFWAECNVGATKPEEYGYYFWWGDTVGYTRSGGTWNDKQERYDYVTWVSTTGEQWSFSSWSSYPTYDKDYSTLLSEGYIDSTGNLVATHDAATAHLGVPWRMPTGAEISALVSNCTTTWITTNGVRGRLVTGRGEYANRSIFLPAAGFGIDPDLWFPGDIGNYWSSTPTGNPRAAYYLYFNYSSNYNFFTNYDNRYRMCPVRPVRGLVQ